VECVDTEFNFFQRDLYKSATIRESEIRSFHVSIGAATNTVSRMTGADAVLLIHYYGFEKSANIKEKDATIAIIFGVLTDVVAVAPPSGSMIEIAMIDGVTGDVLWTNVRGGIRVDELIASQALEPRPNDVGPPVDGEADTTVNFEEISQ